METGCDLSLEIQRPNWKPTAEHLGMAKLKTPYMFLKIITDINFEQTEINYVILPQEAN